MRETTRLPGAGERRLLVLGSFTNFAEKVGQDLGRCNTHVCIGIAQVLKKMGEEGTEIGDKLEIRHRIEHGNPAHDIVACERTHDLHAFGKEWDEASE